MIMLVLALIAYLMVIYYGTKFVVGILRGIFVNKDIKKMQQAINSMELEEEPTHGQQVMPTQSLW